MAGIKPHEIIVDPSTGLLIAETQTAEVGAEATAGQRK